MYLSRFLDFFGWPQRPQDAQIQTQNDKNTRKIRILKTLCNFCLFLENLGGLECQRR